MSALQNILIELEARTDKFGQTYYMGRFRAPMTIKFKAGVAFLVYLSESTYEEMRIACVKPGAECHGVKRRFKPNSNEIDKYVIKLEERIDQLGKPFYVGIVQDDCLELDLGADGMVFFIFTAKKGCEELHIGKNDFVAHPTRDESFQVPIEVTRRGSDQSHRIENNRTKDSGDFYPALPARRVAAG